MSNRADEDGYKLTLSQKLVSAFPGYYIPCVDSSSAVQWGNAGGRSFGVFRSLDYDTAGGDYVWVSMASGNQTGSCGADATYPYCVGAAYMDVSSGTLNRDWFSSVKYPDWGSAPDVVGAGTTNPKHLIADITPAPDKWRLDPGLNSEVALTGYAPSQLHTVNGTWAVATDAGGPRSPNACSTPTNVGRVRLLDWSGTTLSDADSTPPTASGAFKPEGVFVRDITATLQCNYDAIAYVTDYCGDLGDDGRLFVYGINLTGTAIIETDSLTLPDGCKPSTVTYHSPTGKLFVLCQESDQIIPVTLTNACTLGNMETAVDLTFVASAESEPACSVGTPSMTSCNAGDPDPSCQPHDFAWTDAGPFSTAWLFVTLTGLNQVIVVKASDPTVQHGFFKEQGITDFNPLEIEVVGTP